MGGRGSTSSIKVMTEEEYLSSKGYSFMGYAEPSMHISSQHVSNIQKKQNMELLQNRAQEYDKKRAELRKEYKKLVKEGKMRAPTNYEKALKASKGDPNLLSTQAAKRILEKYKERMKNGK